ncbi:CinA family protein [Alistipes provencensis]|uniref:CinA family protein n=1 Tax=Alistipes provencensis TaxID=1816676 RepID=UPI0007EDA52E|nr:CinA family protein [Alistipes provencensis]
MNKIATLLAVLALTASCCGSKPEKRVHKLLMDRMLTLSVAESCTGGSIASRFTAMPGASAYFKGGVISYWNQTKSLLLNVSADTIARYGVVSEQVVRQMAEGARHAVDTHYAIATTGMAGPSGGTPEIPVGTVWIAVSSPERTVTRLIHIKGNRDRVIRETGSAVIELLEEELTGEYGTR